MTEDDPTCMYCGELIADTSAPDRFCSQACFDTLLEKIEGPMGPTVSRGEG